MQRRYEIFALAFLVKKNIDSFNGRSQNSKAYCDGFALAHTLGLYTRYSTSYPGSFAKNISMPQGLKKVAASISIDSNINLLEVLSRNIVMQVAFLRLLGVYQVSLTALKQDNGIATCYLKARAGSALPCPPRLTLSPEVVIKSIIEMKEASIALTPFMLKKVNNDISGDFNVIQNFFAENELEINDLYKAISILSDEEIELVGSYFLGSKDTKVTSQFIVSLKLAREESLVFLEEEKERELDYISRK
ncbi:MAG: hypothetical protein P1U74_00395 [Legionellaceae bacterium]|nr:hypothetical protein [Legionellaceae bacterium]